jgi:4-amino-4-deoxy-L-arabinose transferase-like glycosyltransferase
MLKTYQHRPHTWEIAALVLIMGLAIFLRLGAPSIVEFKRDEANVSTLALDIVHGRQFHLLGIDSSVGIRNAPMSIYLMVPPFVLSSNPMVATTYVGLLNVLAVLLVYMLARRYYGSTAAIIATLLYAVSFWSVIYSRKIWAQDLLAPFILMTVGTALLGFLEGKRWAQLLHLPLLAVTGQIHYAAIGLLPITIYLLVTGRKCLTRYFLMSFVLTILVCLPYFVGAWQSGMFSADTLKQLSAAKSTPPADSVTGEVFDLAIFVIAGTRDYLMIGQQSEPVGEVSSSLPDFSVLLYTLILSILAAIIWLVARSIWWRDNRTPVDLTLILWLVSTPLIFLPKWTTVYPHYMIPILPAAYLVAGVGASEVWQTIAKRITQRTIQIGLGVVGGLFIFAVVITQIYQFSFLLDFVSNHGAETSFGIPLGSYLPIRDKVLAQKPQQIIASLDGQYIGYHNETTIWNTLFYNVPLVRFVDADTDVYPAASALYFAHGCGESDSISLAASDTCYRIIPRTPDQLDSKTFTPTNSNEFSFANGAQVTAYRWDKQAACLFVVWKIDRGPLQEDFQFAVQFTNASGAKVASADSLSWRGRYWHEGDMVIKRFCLKDTSRMAKITGVRLGMYLTETVDGVQKFYPQDLYSTSGAPSGQLLEIAFSS